MKNTFSFLLIAVILWACGDNKEESTAPVSPRVKKSTSVESPPQNQKLVRGTPISFSFSSTGANIDSVQLTVDGSKSSHLSATFDFALPDRKVGTRSIRAKVYCGESSETHVRKVIILSESSPEEMTYTVVSTYPHDVNDYTQGLMIKDGYLYESNGQRGRSTLKKKDLQTGETLQVINLDDDLFGEGLTVVENEFYQLTWTSGRGFVYNEDLEEIRTFNYQEEGWGMTTYGSQIVFTDETEKLYFMDPESFTKQSELEVYDNEGKVDSLNELELIDDKIYANVYQEDFVVVIDPETGEVLQKIDFTGLLTKEEASKADVLNGIAIDPATGKIYVTGKLWPKLFEVTIEPKNI